jgi:hypothetical protein
MVSATINQMIQLGQEAVPGIGGEAKCIIRSLSIEPADELHVNTYQPQGRRYPALAVPDKAWTSFGVSGVALYTEILYLLENIFGMASVTTIGTRTIQRIYIPQLSAAIQPKTWVLQWGDASNINQMTYGVLATFGMRFTPTEVSIRGGAGFGMSKVTGAMFTPSATPMKLVPILGPHVRYFLDARCDTIGMTEITASILTLEWHYRNAFTPYFDSNPSRLDFASHLNTTPTTAITLLLAENDMTRELDVLYSTGATAFLRIECEGPAIELGLNYKLQCDLAIRIIKKAKWGDVSCGASGGHSASGGAIAFDSRGNHQHGIYGRAWTCEIVEDPSWGRAMQIASQTTEVTL